MVDVQETQALPHDDFAEDTPEQERKGDLRRPGRDPDAQQTSHRPPSDVIVGLDKAVRIP
ncbi:hypothetical protein GCM10025780_13120 [Frondihabitans cladoniiphilus]|uniref:Uncharacterized protein n=1 Tax=Frondihabitans cladoniiphilus TaxID=715785 RepID=A0ABP8VSR0_9MICO